MATTAFKGNPVHTVGELPQPGDQAPQFSVTGADMQPIDSDGLTGRRLVLNIFPSVDTGVCSASVRRFNELASSMDNTQVLCVSADLPFALNRFCSTEGIDNVKAASTFLSDFGDSYGVTMTDGPLRGLMARSVIVLDEAGKVLHTELVPEIAQEPDYDAAVAALG